MYQHYFGLTETPFSIAVNPRYLFMSRRHREALAHLLYGVGTGGFILLTGEVGTGKTTLTRCLLEQLPEQTDVAIVLNPALDAPELLATVCDELGIPLRGHQNTLKELTDSLHRYLLDNHARGRRTVLLIDEAQHLGLAVLEQIRLLTNLETHSEKLLQIILVGQPELDALLRRPELRQLNQRITARFHLTPLDREETRAYIRHRLDVAGLPADRELFPARVAARVHRLTGGIPRLINLLCDRVLLGAYGRGEPRASRGLLDQAAREVLGAEGAPYRRWRWAALAAGLLLLVVALAAWLWRAALVVPAQHAEPAAALSVAPPAQRSVAELQPGTAAAVADTGAPDVAHDDPPAYGVAPAGAPMPAWMLPPGVALQRLWRSLVPATDVAVLPADLERLCDLDDIRQPVSCQRGQADSWRALPAGWPALLVLHTPGGFLATGIWLGSRGDQALLWSPAGLQAVPLGELATHWRGGFHVLWRPPAGYSRPLGPGAEGEAVEALARRFAELDGQTRPLATRSYGPALEQRVRLFQVQEGLQADGWAGVQTLQHLEARLRGTWTPEQWADALALSTEGGR